MTDLKTKLKMKFRSGAIPSESDFATLIDAILTRDDLRQTLVEFGLVPAGDGGNGVGADGTASGSGSLGDQLARQRDHAQAAIDALHRRLDALDARILHDLADTRQPGPDAPGAETAGSAAEPEAAGGEALNDTLAMLRREIEALRKQQGTSAAAQPGADRPRSRGLPTAAPWTMPSETAEAERLKSDIDVGLAAATALEARPHARVALFPADGAWHEIPVDTFPAAYRVQASMGPGTEPGQDSAMVASVVFRDAGSRPSIVQQRCHGGGLWLWLVPLGIAAAAGGTVLLLLAGRPGTGSRLSILLPIVGGGLVAIGLAAVSVGKRRHDRTAMWVSWSRKEPLLSIGSGGVALRAAGEGFLKIRSFGKCVASKQVRTVECKLVRLDA